MWHVLLVVILLSMIGCEENEPATSQSLPHKQRIVHNVPALFVDEFNEVKPGLVTVFFPLPSETPENAQILSTSCACTKAELQHDPHKENQIIGLQVTADLRHKVGPVELVSTVGTDQETLYECVIQSHVYERVQWSPRLFQFGQNPNLNDQVTGHVEFYTREESPVTPKIKLEGYEQAIQLECEPPASLHVSDNIIVTKVPIALTWIAKQDHFPRGSGRTHLSAAMEIQRLKFDSSAAVTWELSSQYLIEPARVFFGPNTKASQETIAIVKRQDGEPFNVLDFNVSSQTFSVSHDSVASGKEHRFIIQLETTSTELAVVNRHQFAHGKLQITTDDPDEQIVSIPLSAFITSTLDGKD